MRSGFFASCQVLVCQIIGKVALTEINWGGFVVSRDLDAEAIPLLRFRGRLRNFELGNGTHIFDGLDDNLSIEHSHMPEPLPIDLVATGPLTMGLPESEWRRHQHGP